MIIGELLFGIPLITIHWYTILGAGGITPTLPLLTNGPIKIKGEPRFPGDFILQP